MRFAGAVDIGGTTTKLGIVADDGSVVKRSTVPTSLQGEPIGLVDAIVSSLAPLLDGMKAEQNTPMSGVGISVAGFLDGQRGAMIHNANLPALHDYPLRRVFTERFSLDCRLEVDSNAAVVAEYRYGPGRGAGRLLGVTVGTGLGGGVIINGALLHYTGECAGDLGHIILDPKGRLCTCGARGCLEAMVNSAALSERAGGRRVRDIIASARKGDRLAVDALAETGWWLGLGLASLSPIFSPERIVVGGGIAAAGDLLLEPTRASYRTHATPEFRERTQLIGSTFDGWEGMIGAASLVLEPLS
jgi:glucokinase